MYYLFLFDVAAKDLHDLTKGWDSVFGSKRSRLNCIFEWKREGVICMCCVCAFH